MAGTVTGKDANLWFAAHSGGSELSNIAGKFTSRAHGQFGVGDFSLTLDKGTVEQELVGEVGNYFTFGSLSADGSLTITKFGTSGLSDFLYNMVGVGSADKYKYLAISGQVSDATDETYLSWFLVSCQVTGYDISMGDADTISEASVDYTVIDPYKITYSSPCITDTK